MDHFGETQHDEDARKLVQNAHEKMNRMPLDKASCTTPFGPAPMCPALTCCWAIARTSVSTLQYSLHYITTLSCNCLCNCLCNCQRASKTCDPFICVSSTFDRYLGQVRENIACAHLSPEEVAMRALKAGESNAVKKETGTVEEGVKGSGVEKGSEAARLQVWPKLEHCSSQWAVLGAPLIPSNSHRAAACVLSSLFDTFLCSQSSVCWQHCLSHEPTGHWLPHTPNRPILMKLCTVHHVRHFGQASTLLVEVLSCMMFPLAELGGPCRAWQCSGGSTESHRHAG